MNVYLQSPNKVGIYKNGIFLGILFPQEIKQTSADLGDFFELKFLSIDCLENLSFILSSELLDCGTDNVIVTSACSYTILTFSPTQKINLPFKVLSQLNLTKAKATLYQENGLKLLIEEENGSFIDNLPSNLKELSLEKIAIKGENLIAVKGILKKQFLAIYSPKSDNSALFKGLAEEFIVSDNITQKIRHYDYFSHVSTYVWEKRDSEFKVKEFTLSRERENCPKREELKLVCLLEELKVGGNNFKELLSLSLQDKGQLLKKYLGDFENILLPLPPLNENEILLTYKKTDNAFTTKRVTAEYDNGLISNLNVQV